MSGWQEIHSGTWKFANDKMQGGALVYRTGFDDARRYVARIFDAKAGQWLTAGYGLTKGDAKLIGEQQLAQLNGVR